MKVRVNKDRVRNIALMSIPAAMIAPISIPVSVLMAIGFGSLLTTYSDDEYEIELSWSQWIQLVTEAHKAEEQQKADASMYWRNKYRDSK